MSHVSPFSTPLGSSPGFNSNKSLFHEFVRPRGQMASKFTSSPFKGSPQSDSADFIPLSYSSPINNKNNSANSQWKGNRKSFGYSPNSSSSSGYSPYNTNRNHYRNIHGNSSYNCSYGSNSDMERKSYHNRKRRGNNFLVNPGHCDNISLYYHPSMLEDPWAELEKKLQTSMAVQNCSLGSKGAVEKSVSNLSSVDSVLSLSDSDEGPDMETDSTVSASDGSS